MTFLRNFWYVGAWSNEVGDAPLARTLLGENLVFFRTEAGKVAVFEDRCPHRFAPLSLGRVIGETLQCGYHGFTFGADGQCVSIPGVDRVPAQVCVRQYPVIERFGWVYVWMGEAADADESQLPPYHMMGEDSWAGSGETLRIEANYQLVRDNLLDLSHAKYVHRQTLATDEVDEVPIEVETKDSCVSVLRVMRDIKPSPFFAKAGGFQSNVVHHQLTEYWPGCNIVIRVRNKAIPSPKPEQQVRFRVLNALVPESENSTLYFWWLGRDFALDDDAVGKSFHKANADTFLEDKLVIEAQQKEMERVPDGRPIVAPGDAGVEAAHKLDAHLLAAEQQSRRATAAE